MVGIVILNYNNAEDTLNCITSILRLNTYPAKIIIVDNGSTQTSATTAIESWLAHNQKNRYTIIHEGDSFPDKLADITFFVSSHNDGYAQGNNKGLNLTYKYDEIKEVMILNSDILFVEDIIGCLVEDLKSLPNAAIISPILYKKDLQGIDYNCARKAIPLSDLFLEYFLLFHDIFGILSKKRKRRYLLIDKKIPLENPIIEIELPSGSCMLADKEFFRRIGSFDPNTFLYNEENILWVKINRLKKKNYLDSRLKCIHLGATTISEKAASEFVLNCSIESNQYFLKNYTDASTVYLLCMKMLYAILRLKFKIKKSVKLQQ